MVKNKRQNLSVPERHMLKVAKDTLNTPDALTGVFGITKAEARSTLKRYGYTQKQIDKFEGK